MSSVYCHLKSCIFLWLKAIPGECYSSKIDIIEQTFLPTLYTTNLIKHDAGSLVDLFNSCQLHVSYTKYVKLFFKVFDQGKSSSLFAW